MYEYHYKDHLGNLRLAYREGKEATMDAVNAPTEEREFANLALTRDASKKRGATGESCQVNTAENKPIGAWKSIPVTQGDKVKAKVFSHYVANTNNNNATSLFLALGNNALAYGTQTLPTGETKLPPSPFTNLTAGLQVLLTPNSTNTQIPKAYLAVVHYNEQNVIVGTSFSAVTTASLSSTWAEHTLNFEATANGRIEVFVANESNTNVWFDDLEVSHTGTMIVQETHYDPWGMELVGIGKKGAPDNKFSYNGKEKTEEFGLLYHDFGARNYDAQLGKWHAIDPLADKYISYSPYAYCLNNPIKNIDPDGKAVQDVKGGTEPKDSPQGTRLHIITFEVRTQVSGVSNWANSGEDGMNAVTTYTVIIRTKYEEAKDKPNLLREKIEGVTVTSQSDYSNVEQGFDLSIKEPTKPDGGSGTMTLVITASPIEEKVVSGSGTEDNTNGSVTISGGGKENNRGVLGWIYDNTLGNIPGWEVNSGTENKKTTQKASEKTVKGTPTSFAFDISAENKGTIKDGNGHDVKFNGKSKSPLTVQVNGCATQTQTLQNKPIKVVPSGVTIKE